MTERKGTKGLELWCKKMTEGYPGVKVENMTTSWRDGLAFCAIIHHFRPELIDFAKLNKDDVYRNNELAFRVAEKYLGIPALLEAEDMVEYPVPDRLSILTYLSQFYQVFACREGSPSRIAAKRTASATDRGIVSPASTSPPTKMEVRGVGVGVPRRLPCAKCSMPVFIAERLNVGSLLYHRTCFRCARCGGQLNLASCYETETEGQYCCEVCPDEEKQPQPPVIERSLSDEEKSAAKLCVPETTVDFSSCGKSDEFLTARSHFFSALLDDAEDSPPPLPDSGPPDLSVNSFISGNQRSTANTDVIAKDCERSSLVKARMRLFQGDRTPQDDSFVVNRDVVQAKNGKTNADSAVVIVSDDENSKSGTNNDQKSEIIDLDSSDSLVVVSSALTNNAVSEVIEVDSSGTDLDFKSDSSAKVFDSSANVEDSNYFKSVTSLDSSAKFTDSSPNFDDSIAKMDDLSAKVIDSSQKSAKVIGLSAKVIDLSQKSAKVIGLSAKIDDSSSKTTDLNVKIDDSSTKVHDLSVKIQDSNDLSPKFNDSSAKAIDLSPKINVSGAKVIGLSTKNDGSCAKVIDSSAKIVDLSVKADDLSTKVDDSNSKLTSKANSSLKVADSNAKIQDSRSKVDDSSAKVIDSSPKIVNSSAKVVDFSAEVDDSNVKVKVEEISPKVDDSNAKIIDSIAPKVVDSSTKPEDADSRSNVVYSNAKIVDSSANIQDSSVKVLDSNQKVVDSSPKVHHLSAKVVDSNVKVEGSSVKVDDLKLNVVEDSNAKVANFQDSNANEENVFYPESLNPFGSDDEMAAKPTPAKRKGKTVSPNVGETKVESVSTSKPEKPIPQLRKIKVNMEDFEFKRSTGDTPELLRKVHTKRLTLGPAGDEVISKPLLGETGASTGEGLNPFGSDDEEELEPKTSENNIRMSSSSHYEKSLNPFGDDESEAEEESPKLRKIKPSPDEFVFKRSTGDTPEGLRTVYTKRLTLGPSGTEQTVEPVLNSEDANHQLNPFGSDDEEETDLKRNTLASPGRGTLSSYYGSSASISSGTSSVPSTRKKKPAPRPPIPAEFHLSPQQSPIQSLRGSPKLRKNKRAPLPPPTTSTPLVIKRDLTNANESPGTLVNTCDGTDLHKTKTEEANDSFVSVESGDYENEKVVKDEVNRNRQNQSGNEGRYVSATPNKSTYGKWKRKKGQAPTRPVPEKRAIKALPTTEVRRELDIIEVQQQGLERQGVRLEEIIRERCEGPGADPDGAVSIETEDLILQLFEVVNEKNELCRRQAELMYLQRQHRLEEEYAEVEYQIRCLMLRPALNKTDYDKEREEELIARLVDIVERRNEIIECLEIDRIREAEEDDSISVSLNNYAAKREETSVVNEEPKKEKKSKKKFKKFKFRSSPKVDADKDVDESESSLSSTTSSTLSGKEKKKERKFRLF